MLAVSPRPCGTIRTACQIDTPGRMFNEEEDIQGLEGQCFNGEEIASEEIDLVSGSERCAMSFQNGLAQVGYHVCAIVI